jgi:S-adenosylmethionine:diacylglycerol 3-amino-3-carboxypropyl transferase
MKTQQYFKPSKQIKFATVREDPNIIIPLIKQYKIKKLLTICSGGCSALSYKAMYPELCVAVFDKNLAQIKLLDKKLKILTSVNNSSTTQKLMKLNSNGVFEDIFKCFRSFINTFLISKVDLKQALVSNENISQYAYSIFNNKYWQLAFEMFFADSFLKATFGLQAVQNAAENSYAKYFQNCFEEGILKANRQENYFLHYALLGEYINKHLPVYMHKKLANKSIQMYHGSIWDINDITDYDLIDLSNIFDWMSLDETKAILNLLAENTKRNCMIIFRNLNNVHNYDNLITTPFVKNKLLSQQLHNNSKDLFYSSITVLEKQWKV